MDKYTDIAAVVYANSVVYLALQFATPVLSFITACLSLYYIFRKIKKEFF